MVQIHIEGELYLERNHDSLPRSGSAGRQVLISDSPSTLILPQHEFQNSSFHPELMRQPIFRPRFAIQRSALNINCLIIRIKIDIPDRGRLAALLVRHIHLPEITWRDQIDILTRNRPETHHRQGGERAHGARVVVPRETGHGVVELRGDVEMAVLGAESRSACVVELEDGEEGLLVAYVEQAGGVEVLEALDEGGGAAEGEDQSGHVLWHEEGIHPC